MGKFLIVNADDFGMSVEINKGIEEAHRNGIVTNASLLANRDGFEDALSRIKDNPKLGIGAHLNVFRGKSLEAHKYITDQNGNFWKSIPVFVLRFLMFRAKFLREIEKEFEKQILKLKENGVEISHLDTEKHVHIIPSVMEIVVRLARRYDIPAVRFPNEKLASVFFCKPSLSQALKAFGSFFFGRKNLSILKKSGVYYSDHFAGMLLSGSYSNENFENFLREIKPGVTELSCHPGYSTQEIHGYIDKSREDELGVLTDGGLDEILDKLGIELKSYKQVINNEIKYE